MAGHAGAHAVGLQRRHRVLLAGSPHLLDRDQRACYAGHQRRHRQRVPPGGASLRAVPRRAVGSTPSRCYQVPRWWPSGPTGTRSPTKTNWSASVPRWSRVSSAAARPRSRLRCYWSRRRTGRGVSASTTAPSTRSPSRTLSRSWWSTNSSMSYTTPSTSPSSTSARATIKFACGPRTSTRRRSAPMMASTSSSSCLSGCATRRRRFSRC